MLLTLALLRKGYVTRYLNERLAVGLAAPVFCAAPKRQADHSHGPARGQENNL